MGKALCSRNKDLDFFSTTDPISPAGPGGASVPISTSATKAQRNHRDSGYSSASGPISQQRNRENVYGINNGTWNRRGVAEKRVNRSHRNPVMVLSKAGSTNSNASFSEVSRGFFLAN